MFVAVTECCSFLPHHQVRLDFEEFVIQPPILGNCHYDKLYVTANGDYPLLCGQNSGHHIYLDVAGKSFTDITIQAETLRSELYNCPDRFGIAAQTSDISYAVVRTKKYTSVHYKPSQHSKYC